MVRLLLRVFLRLAKLQLVNLKVQQLLSLPSTACMDICLCWEVADPNLCREVAFTLLTSLKPTKRQRLIVELRESVLRALDVAAKRLDAINKRPDCPVLCPLLSAAQADHTSSSWQAATAGALQHLIEVLSTLRVATCCLPVSFALELWERRQDKDSSHPTIEAMLNALRRPEAPKIVEAPFAALLRRVYAKLVRFKDITRINLQTAFKQHVFASQTASFNSCGSYSVPWRGILSLTHSLRGLLTWFRHAHRGPNGPHQSCHQAFIRRLLGLGY